MIDRIEEKALQHKGSMYFHREILYYSLEGRKMEMFTISSRDQIHEDEQEEQVSAHHFYMFIA